MVKGNTIKDSFIARWAVLLLDSAVLFFNYYFYNALFPLKDLMQTPEFFFTDYGLFISAYSVPLVFLLMAVLGGGILDKIGMGITGFSFITPIKLRIQIKDRRVMDLNY